MNKMTTNELFLALQHYLGEDVFFEELVAVEKGCNDIFTSSAVGPSGSKLHNYYQKTCALYRLEKKYLTKIYFIAYNKDDKKDKGD